MRANKLRKILYMQLAAAFCAGFYACNTASENEEMVITSSNVAVRNFYFEENSKVMKNLDSVFFSIDLERGVIFNADSLPIGTKVNRLIPVITFANDLSKADLVFNKDNIGDTTVNYLTNATDSIDFTHPVRLNLTAQDGITRFSYLIKVNVHTVKPDTVEWAKLATADLPSMYPDPKAQKTIWHNSMAYCLLEENNGEFTLATSANLNEGDWKKEKIEPDFNFNIATFTSSNTNFYILDNDGRLLVSSDGLSWDATGETWVSIQGGYQECVLGIKNSGSGLIHTQYPLREGYIETPVENNFPVYNSSSLQVIENKWAKFPTAIMACGVTSSGDYSSHIWAFDGNVWTIISNNPLPALKAPMMVRYVVFKDTPVPNVQREFDAWLLFGGTMADDYFNLDVYYSLDNGVNWALAPSGMQLTDKFPELYCADAFTADYDMTADLADAWTLKDTKNTRGSFTIDGTEITWKCPYIYVFGGYTIDQKLSTQIWRGVLNRVKFTPEL